MTDTKNPDQETRPQRIIASGITIVDGRGRTRIRLGVDDDGTAAVKLFDQAEHLRAALFLKQRDDGDEDSHFEFEGGELGLLMVDRAGSIRLTIDEDGLVGKRPRLEITEAPGSGRRRHRFPPRPPSVDD